MEVALFKLTLRNSIWARAPATNKVKIRTDIAENRIQNDNCYHTRCIYRGDLVEYFYHILIWFCNFKSRSEQIEIFKKNCFFKPILTCIQSLWKMSTIAIFYTVKKSKNRIKLEEGIKFNFYYRGGAQETTIIVIHFPEY